jgi:hypothetical protein
MRLVGAKGTDATTFVDNPFRPSTTTSPIISPTSSFSPASHRTQQADPDFDRKFGVLLPGPLIGPVTATLHSSKAVSCT